MFKCMALLRKRADISREQFIDYYQNNHSVLIRSLLPGIIDYRSNFLDMEGAFLFPDAALIDFDVITEIWLPDHEAHQRFLARATDPEIARRLAEDEAMMCDGAATRMVLVEEHTSPMGAIL